VLLHLYDVAEFALMLIQHRPIHLPRNISNDAATNLQRLCKKELDDHTLTSYFLHPTAAPARCDVLWKSVSWKRPWRFPTWSRDHMTVSYVMFLWRFPTWSHT